MFETTETEFIKLRERKGCEESENEENKDGEGHEERDEI